ncbi:MAG: ribonucleoside-diphosphate reductase, adenosylcobalamin-dependent [Deltaproteobacteria bacterium RIFOXYA12_FULL_61_11]|nr:MAG: ribonucleoside-diphosphate reductase, adenosylcobalamin-dependent [Deltaproteobacteria bacterium RIFOXYA12_FULL_61_11]
MGQPNARRTADSPRLTSNARRVLEKRYLLKDSQNNLIEDPETLFRRVAYTVAQASRAFPGEDAEQDAVVFEAMMRNLEFLPNSPTLMNAGKPLGQLSACFVLPVPDSLDGIFETLKQAAMIHKTGGGTGFSFSRLRPKNSLVRTTSGVSSGPLSFIQVFDSATEAVKQGGTRRGANMAILRVDHPDILEFIKSKWEDGKINNFNISVAVTAEFMRALEHGGTYDLVHPQTREVVRSLKARDVFETLVDAAWKNGEPGIVFLDRINEANPTPALGDIESTNPCGEQPLLAYESCNLGSINLSKMMTWNEGTREVDWALLRRTTRNAVKFLDNVIEVNNYPLAEIRELTRGNRKIGLGVMGFADLLFQLGLPYDSENALQVAEDLMQTIEEEGRAASAELGHSRGNFANFEKSVYPGREVPAMRNATVTTIAPTGTISIIANTTSGIEPVFGLSYKRNVLEGETLFEVNPWFERAVKERGLYTDVLMDKVAAQGSLRSLSELPDDLKRVFVTAHDITPDWHVRMQAAFQKHTDNAVSKTVNFPNNARRDDVGEVFLKAYHLGCKGVTVYRDGSRVKQVLQRIAEEKSPEPTSQQIVMPLNRPRPAVTSGTTRKIKTGCGSIYVTINVDESGQPFELFTTMGKAGGCASSQAEAISRLISYLFRTGANPEIVFQQLRGISCHRLSWDQGNKVLSCADAIGQALEKHLHRTQGVTPPLPAETQQAIVGGGACPECGSVIERESGCATCRTCGYSECS